MKHVTSVYSAMTVFAALLVSADAEAIKHTVQVANFQFSPSSLTGVAVGDTIRWEWQSGSHTTTSTSVPPNAQMWDAPLNSNNTSFEYRVLAAGSYSYKCTPHEGIGMTGTFTAIEVPTAVPLPAAKEAVVKFYPNPVTERVHVFFRSDVAERGVMNIYDAKGALMMNLPLRITPGDNSLDVPLGILSRGMYMLELLSGSRVLRVHKIDKM
ncbi:MAG TPA: plastocyanin/azurin family copper-binding protein [Chitinophagales bacterium]|nr:plastocyanin/azurin family copper-binding protein [Chitinophagales bacterium]